jgi:Tol biopolymer transport system component
MDGFAVQPLAGTDDAMSPFWSPDSRSIGFFAARKLKRVPAAGGPVQTICDAQDGRGGSWSADDVIAFAPAPFGGLWKVAATGGAPVALTKVDSQGRTHRLPWFLPDGKHLLYVSGTQTSDDEKGTSIQALDLATGKSTLVARENSEGRFAEPGFLVFVREGNLLAQPFDRKALKTTGPAVPIAEGVAFEAFRWVGKFTLSKTGRLVYQSNEAFRKSRLSWFDLDGKPLGSVGEAANFFTVSLSPDGRRVAATVLGDKSARPELRLYDLDRGVGSRFTFGGQGANFPVWSPDGSEIAFGDPGSGVRIKAADGSSESKLIVPQKANIWPLSWVDGKRMLLRIQDNQTGGVDLWDLPLEGEAKLRKLIPTDPDDLRTGAVSPDGKWLLYVSNETGRREVYVVPYPSMGEKRQVSTSGASSGIWLGRSAILYDQPPDGRLFVVDVDTQGGALRLGAPRPVFGGKPPPRGPFDATRDGKRLLFAAPLEDSSSAQIRFVSDWRADLGAK